MTSEAPPAEPSLDFLAEPALLVTPSGHICSSNAAARESVPEATPGAELAALLEDPPQQVAGFLRAAVRSSAPIVGALHLRMPDGVERFRVHGARLKSASPAGAGPRIVLRFLAAREDRFRLLDRRVRELDQQLRRRMSEKAVLQEALAKNQILLRELHHRVKNNMQLMISLVQLSAADRPGEEAAAMALALRGRLSAMARLQDAIYSSEDAKSVAVGPFLAGLVHSMAEGYGLERQIDAQIAATELRLDATEAQCLALITNELITNAAKHGLQDNSGNIRIRLDTDGERCLLEVRDEGPGFDQSNRGRGSGLRLVRGLCRQIGARLEIGSAGGTVCRVHFDAGRRWEESNEPRASRDLHTGGDGATAG